MERRPQSRKNITQPDDWWKAFEEAAAAAGMSLSEWLGDCARRRLPKETREQLSQRHKGGRPAE